MSLYTIDNKARAFVRPDGTHCEILYTAILAELNALAAKIAEAERDKAFWIEDSKKNTTAYWACKARADYAEALWLADERARKIAELTAKLADAEALLVKSKACVRHVLGRVRDVPELYWNMGAMTEAWNQLTTTGAALFDQPVDKVVEAFTPDREEYNEWLKRREETERLAEIGREHDESEKESD